MKKIFNWKQFNENFGHEIHHDMGHEHGEEHMHEFCEGCGNQVENCVCHEMCPDCGEHQSSCTCEHGSFADEHFEECGEETGRCMCHVEQQDEYDRVPDFGIHEKMNKGFKAFLDKKKAEKEEKEDKKESKGKTPTTKKEKELAAKYPPKDKITRGDIITAAKEKAKKK